MEKRLKLWVTTVTDSCSTAHMYSVTGIVAIDAELVRHTYSVRHSYHEQACDSLSCTPKTQLVANIYNGGNIDRSSSVPAASEKCLV